MLLLSPSTISASADGSDNHREHNYIAGDRDKLIRKTLAEPKEKDTDHPQKEKTCDTRQVYLTLDEP